MTFDTTINPDGDEIDVTVTYEASGSSRGACDRYGAPLEPDEDEDLEITGVTDSNGLELWLCNADLDRLEKQCWADYASQHED